MKSKLPACFCHFVGVFRDDYFIGAEAKSVVLLAGRGGEDNSVRSERVRELDAHMAKSAEADNADLLAFGHAPVMHRRVGGDSGAEQRRGPSKIEIRRHAQHEALCDNNAVGVAAVRNAARVLVGKVVREDHVRAELLKACFALRASAIGVHQAAHCGKIARLEFGDCGANLRDAADDLVAGNTGIDGRHDSAPLVACLVEIGVADAAEQNLDLHIVFGGVAPRDGGGCKRRCRAGNGISFCLVHENLPRLPGRWRAVRS